MTPRFEHDCDKCVHLGPFQMYDLYLCPKQALGPSVIARYGSEGPDYTSSPVKLVPTGFLGVSGATHELRPLVEAVRIARHRGLIPRPA